MAEASRTRLNLVGRVFVGFEQALAAQIAHFERAHPDVEVATRLLEPPGPSQAVGACLPV